MKQNIKWQVYHFNLVSAICNTGWLSDWLIAIGLSQFYFLNKMIIDQLCGEQPPAQSLHFIENSASFRVLYTWYLIPDNPASTSSSLHIC